MYVIKTMHIYFVGIPARKNKIKRIGTRKSERLNTTTHQQVNDTILILNDSDTSADVQVIFFVYFQTFIIKIQSLNYGIGFLSKC